MSIPCDIWIKGGLLDAKHRAAMGEAVWLYLYVEACRQWEKPWSFADVERALEVAPRTVRRWYRRLRRGGYVEAPTAPSTTPTPEWLKEHRRLRPLVIARDGLVCGICGGDVLADDVSIDHIYPQSRGGATTMGNLRVTHRRCNARKGNRV